MALQVTRNEVQLRRSELKARPLCRFVTPERFVRLATSSRRFLRADDRLAKIRGLMDPETGEWYMTEEERLFA